MFTEWILTFLKCVYSLLFTQNGFWNQLNSQIHLTNFTDGDSSLRELASGRVYICNHSIDSVSGTEVGVGSTEEMSNCFPSYKL